MLNGRANRGFTLVELMVTLVLAIVIVGALYMIYTQSVSAYRMENQYLDMQERVRFGLEHLKRDLRRAGFLATPNSAIDQDVCPKPAFDLRAVTLTAGPGAGSVFEPSPGTNPNVEPSAIVLFGDFFSGRVFQTTGIQGNRIFLVENVNLPGCELNPADNNVICVNDVEFNRVFNSNRYLRIMTQDQFEVLLPIQSANWDDRSVTVTQAVPMVSSGSLCGIVGFGQGLEVNVAGFVRYRLAFDTRPNATVGKTDLIREELQVDGVSIVPGTQLVIADFVVDLQFYDFGFEVGTPATGPNIVRFPLVTDLNNRLGATAAATPHDLRFLTAKLTVRTENEDPQYFYEPRQSLFEPLEGFETTDMEGACRTLSLASRVQLTSLTVRNLKPQGGGGP